MDAVHRLTHELGVSQFDAGRILGLSQEDLSQLPAACPPAADGGMRTDNGPAVPAASRPPVPGWLDARRQLSQHPAQPARMPRKRPSWATEEWSG